MQSLLRTFADPGADLQAQSAAAVVIPTVLRASIVPALDSIFAQVFPGRIQVLIGCDRPGDLSLIESACRGRPSHCVVQVFWPGYSTNVRNMGLSPAQDGGVLRCILTHLANSQFVAYLDDDNWWGPEHLASLRIAIHGSDWAFGLRWFVHPETRRSVCVDTWESVGPGLGVFAERFGGFVDPNCLMIDKRRCGEAISRWVDPLPNDPKGMSADRNVFEVLRRLRGAGTGRPTAFYNVDVTDGMHPVRLIMMRDAWDNAAQPVPPAPDR